MSMTEANTDWERFVAPMVAKVQEGRCPYGCGAALEAKDSQEFVSVFCHCCLFAFVYDVDERGEKRFDVNGSGALMEDWDPETGEPSFRMYRCEHRTGEGTG